MAEELTKKVISTKDADDRGVVKGEHVEVQVATPTSESDVLVTLLHKNVERAAECLEQIETQRKLAVQVNEEALLILNNMRDGVPRFNERIDQAIACSDEIKARHATTLEQRAEATAVLESIKSAATGVNDALARIETIRTTAETAQGVIASKSEHIEGGRAHVDNVRIQIDAALTQVQQLSGSAEGQFQAAKAAKEQLDAIAAEGLAAKTALANDAQAAKALRASCEEHRDVCGNIASIADSSESRVKSYEEKLQDLIKQADERLKTIEALLPGATGAGLASAFNKRKSNFKWPQIVWQLAFVACIGGLLAVAAWALKLFETGGPPHTLDSLWLSLLFRLPLAIPLIWLAIHASHRAALLQRVEEDYAFKETVSSSFEGFRREMADLATKSSPDSPLSNLCNNVLAVITRRPGLIYEKHPLTKTPTDSIVEIAGPLAEAATKAGAKSTLIGRIIQ